MTLIEQLTQWTGQLAALISYNPITLTIIVGTGLYLTIRLSFVQITGFTAAWRLLWKKSDNQPAAGEVSHFQALSTALSATVGTGNIAGVATAISLGGPGALFWMWITAFVGMATKFAESTLALKFREVNAEGVVSGGPMYTLLHGVKRPGLAILYAGFALISALAIGNLVQANSVVDGLVFIAPEIKDYAWLVGVGFAIPLGLVILGGVKRIAIAASAIVPIMVLLYVISGIIVLFDHITLLPAALKLIFTQALNPWAVGGAAVGEAIRWGVIRGLFSNEAGLGSSAMAHAAARTNEPVREGLVAMLEPFIDTLLICSLTGLVIVVTGVYQQMEGLAGASMTALAFSQTFGDSGGWIVGISLVLFAYSTMLSWSYYGDRCAKFIFGEKAVKPYRVIYTVLVVIGASIPLHLVWNLADITTVLMAVPNLIGLLILSKLLVKLKQEYFGKQNQ